MLIDDAKHHTLFTTNVHCVAIRKYACLVLFIHHSRLFYLNPLRLFGCNSGYWSPSVFVLVPAGVLRCTFIATAANGMEKKGALNCDFLLHTWSLIEAPGMVWVEGVQCTMASQWWRLSVWLWHEDVNNASSERLDKTTPATATGTWRWTMCADIAVELFCGMAVTLHNHHQCHRGKSTKGLQNITNAEDIKTRGIIWHEKLCNIEEEMQYSMVDWISIGRTMLNENYFIQCEQIQFFFLFLRTSSSDGWLADCELSIF